MHFLPFKIRVVPRTLQFKQPAGTSRGIYYNRKVWYIVITSSDPQIHFTGLGELIRMHFAITGEFDYNTPFVISMRFPAEEESDSKRSAQEASLELSQGIVELIQTVLGLEEGEPLPEDVVIDILSKYSFLDPTDIERTWRYFFSKRNEHRQRKRLHCII